MGQADIASAADVEVEGDGIYEGVWTADPQPRGWPAGSGRKEMSPVAAGKGGGLIPGASPPATDRLVPIPQDKTFLSRIRAAQVLRSLQECEAEGTWGSSSPVSPPGAADVTWEYRPLSTNV